MKSKQTNYNQPERHKNRPLFPKTGVQLHCPKCESDILANDINIERGLAKCQNCNNVFSFEDELKRID